MNNCVDCGKEISNHAMRCKGCSNKNRAKRYKWSLKAKKRRTGEGNPLWRGDMVGCSAVHEWVRFRKPKPILCERCNKNPAKDLANISGEYRRDINDYEWLCRKCHMKSDGRLKNRDGGGRFALSEMRM